MQGGGFLRVLVSMAGIGVLTSSTVAGAGRGAVVATPDVCPAPLVYRGGPLMQHVKVVTLFWGPTVNPYQGQLENFFATVTNSPYFDWLAEYDVPQPGVPATTAYSINRGSWSSSFQDSTPSNSSKTLSDSDIQQELRNRVDAGTLTSDADTLFMIYFPQDYTVVAPSGEQSCTGFCGYHWSTTSTAGAPIRYGVIPDVTQTPCRGGCGNSPTQFDNLTSVSSHEMIESVTDPDVALSQMGWYNNLCGEIGDQCNTQQGTVAGLTVQLEWSNKYNKCMVTPDSPDMGTLDLAAPPDQGSADGATLDDLAVLPDAPNASPDLATTNASSRDLSAGDMRGPSPNGGHGCGCSVGGRETTGGVGGGLALLISLFVTRLRRTRRRFHSARRTATGGR
jgi:hypothetical protein